MVVKHRKSRRILEASECHPGLRKGNSRNRTPLCHVGYLCCLLCCSKLPRAVISGRAPPCAMEVSMGMLILPIAHNRRFAHRYSDPVVLNRTTCAAQNQQLLRNHRRYTFVSSVDREEP